LPFNKLFDKYKESTEKKHILLGTLKIVKEGLDLDYLDTLIFCTPPNGGI
jgi:hypothetical protein